jgi:hypothetical protein
MVKLEIPEIYNIKTSDKEKILLDLIESNNRGWLSDTLQELNIPNRSKIHKAFAYQYTWNQTEDEKNAIIQRKKEALEMILNNSDITKWLHRYFESTSASSFMRTIKNTLGINKITLELSCD